MRNKANKKLTVQIDQEKLIEKVIGKRKKLGITQTDLVKMSGLSQASIARFESMKSNPTLKTIVKILNAMDMKLTIIDKE